jgi:hypothetical protein
MKMAARTSETLVQLYQTTRCYNPEDSHLQRLRTQEVSIIPAFRYTSIFNGLFPGSF